jgi:hypothetical protein
MALDAGETGCGDECPGEERTKTRQVTLDGLAAAGAAQTRSHCGSLRLRTKILGRRVRREPPRPSDDFGRGGSHLLVETYFFSTLVFASGAIVPTAAMPAVECATATAVIPAV